MNEQIQQLAKQAGIHAEYTPGMIPLLEKFAELIVRECSAYCKKQGLAPSVFSAEDLLEHFGVE